MGFGLSCPDTLPAHTLLVSASSETGEQRGSGVLSVFAFGFHFSVFAFSMETFLSQYIAYLNALLMYYLVNFLPFLSYIICVLWTLDFRIPIHCLPVYVAYEY